MGYEASGHARCFERLLSDLRFELWIGDAAAIHTKRVRKQKTDRQDAQTAVYSEVFVSHVPRLTLLNGLFPHLSLN
jgi:hypothetical protein